MSTYKIILICHGETCWDQQNRICGWYDSDLCENGIQQVKRCGQVLKEGGFEIDHTFTSVMKRAIRTLWTILDDTNQMYVPVRRAWRLNDRHYGSLTGLTHAEAAAKYGEAQVKIWRFSYDVPPPPMEADHEFYNVIRKDRRYSDLTEDLPSCESLKDTVARTLPLWNEEIAPLIKKGKRVLIVSNGNSLRGIIKHMEGLSEEALVELNIPKGIPILYELDKNLKSVKPMQILEDQEMVRQAMESMAGKGKAK
ncbi:hypothetical protein P4O66_013646, partial [Electrophorus voltai]